MKITKITLSIIALFALTFGANIFSAYAEGEVESNKPQAKLRGPAEFQKVIDEYKAYVAKIPQEIRDEVIEYRKSVAKLNKQKRVLYKELSQASQNYLKKEQQYKKKLPMNRKSLINIQDPGNKPNKENEKKKD